jgi:RNA polymerase sigma-70 factor, ECF subfamily
MDDRNSRSGLSSLDGELCERVRAGDTKAEAIVVAQLQPGLRLVLHRATGGDWDLTSELVQETLVILLERLRGRGLDDPSGLAAFAAQTARNLAIANHRKRNRRRTETNLEAVGTAADPRNGPPEQIAATRLGGLVDRLLQELPTERDRTVLKRFYLHEDDKKDICRDLQLSDLAFNQVLFRARNRFRSILKDAGLKKDDLFDSEPAT